MSGDGMDVDNAFVGEGLQDADGVAFNSESSAEEADALENKVGQLAKQVDESKLTEEQKAEKRRQAALRPASLENLSIARFFLKSGRELTEELAVASKYVYQNAEARAILSIVAILAQLLLLLLALFVAIYEELSKKTHHVEIGAGGPGALPKLPDGANEFEYTNPALTGKASKNGKREVDPRLTGTASKKTGKKTQPSPATEGGIKGQGTFARLEDEPAPEQEEDFVLDMSGGRPLTPARQQMESEGSLPHLPEGANKFAYTNPALTGKVDESGKRQVDPRLTGTAAQRTRDDSHTVPEQDDFVLDMSGDGATPLTPAMQQVVDKARRAEAALIAEGQAQSQPLEGRASHRPSQATGGRP